jgi:signal transduction histidine kinase
MGSLSLVHKNYEDHFGFNNDVLYLTSILTSQISEYLRFPQLKMNQNRIINRLAVTVLILFSVSFTAFSITQADSLVRLGELQVKQKKFSPAKATYLKAIKFYKHLGDEINLIVVMNNIGRLEEEIKQNDSAMRYYRLGLSLADEITDSTASLEVTLNTANLLFKINRYSEAKTLLNKEIRISDNAGLTGYLTKGRQMMAKLLFKQGNYKDAYNQLSRSIRFSDSISLIRNKQRIDELGAKYKKDIKEARILIPQRQEPNGPLNFIKSTFALCLIILIAILIGAISAFFYIRIKNKEKIANLLLESNHQLELQKTKLKLVGMAKDKFYTITSQDLRTPFTTILGFADILKEEYGTLEEKEKMLYIRAIHSSSFNIYELLKNLHDWSRLQSETLESKSIAFDLAEMAEQHLQLFTSYAQNKDIQISIESEGHPKSFADRNMVSAIIRNLLNNAIKFTNKGGEVHVKVMNSDGKVELSVTDTGVGMSEENLKKLFNPDGVFRSKGTADEPGTGLGLILCKKFVTLNNGSIRAESAPGKGSRFTITLPASPTDKI